MSLALFTIHLSMISSDVGDYTLNNGWTPLRHSFSYENQSNIISVGLFSVLIEKSRYISIISVFLCIYLVI